MTAAQKYPRPLRRVSADAAPKAPPAPGSGVGRIGQRRVPGEVVLRQSELASLHPKLPPRPPPGRIVDHLAAPTIAEPRASVAAPVVMSADHAALSLEMDGDDDVALLMASKRRSRRLAWLVCSAFPAVIGLALVTVSGGGHINEPLIAVLAPATHAGETIHIKLERDRIELAAIKAELAAAEAAPPKPR